MFALFIEVDANETHVEPARQFLPEIAVPNARKHGAKAGYWLAPQGGRAVSVAVFETEEEAREAAKQFRIGESPIPGAPEGVTVRTVEVREVLAAV